MINRIDNELVGNRPSGSERKGGKGGRGGWRELRTGLPAREKGGLSEGASEGMWFRR